MRRLAIVSLAAMLAGCFTSSGDEEELVSVSLASTRLAGSYTLVDYLIENGDGMRYDPSVLPVTGTLVIHEDGSYLQGVRVFRDSTTKGRITQVKTPAGDKDRGELFLTLEKADSSVAGKSSFAFRHDTLVLVTEVSKEQDAAKKGYRETDYFLRDPAPLAD